MMSQGFGIALTIDLDSLLPRGIRTLQSGEEEEGEEAEALGQMYVLKSRV